MEGEREGYSDERLIFAVTQYASAGLPAPLAPDRAEDRLPAGTRTPDRSRASGRPWRIAWERVAAAVETEIARGTGFVLLPVLLAAGAVTYFSLPYEPQPLVLMACALVAAGAAFALRASETWRLVAVAILFVLLGMLAGSAETWRHGTPMTGSSIATRITGQVVAIEERAGGRIRLTIDLISTERPELRYAPERFRATTAKVPADLAPGDGVFGYVRLLPASGPARPGGYDFAFENYFDGIGANGFFLSGPEEVALESSGSAMRAVRAWVERQRLALAKHIRSRIGGPEGEVAAALVAGVRAGIPDDVTEALRRTGLAHILAISGLHMALVAGTVIAAMRYGFALFPGFASRHPVKKYAAVGGLVALVLYLVISGAAVAAQRAFIMFAVMLVAVLFDRAALTMRNLAIAALIILVIAPHEVMGPSFQMSFAATAALIGFYSWYSDYRMRRQRGWKASTSPLRSGLRLVVVFFAGLAATSIIAGLATGLFAVWHFQRIAPLGLIANLAAMPIVTIAVMPSAVMGALTMPFGLDAPFFAIMGKALASVIAVAQDLAQRSPVDVVGAIPASAVCVLALALAAATMMTTWLRAAALPVLAVGILLITTYQRPDLLVSEDTRMVGLLLTDGSLAVNTARPSSFTLGIWQAGLDTEEIVKPEKAEGVLSTDGFACGDGLCLARHETGVVVAYADNGDAALGACGEAALIVIDDATVENVCDGGSAVVITKRELAWRGSAAVRFAFDNANVTYAIGPTLRPWHDQRRWSREARGLPPYRRKKSGDQ